MTAEWVTQLLDEESDKLRRQMGEQRWAKSRYELAKRVLAGTIQVGGRRGLVDSWYGTVRLDVCS